MLWHFSAVIHAIYQVFSVCLNFVSSNFPLLRLFFVYNSSLSVFHLFFKLVSFSSLLRACHFCVSYSCLSILRLSIELVSSLSLLGVVFYYSILHFFLELVSSWSLFLLRACLLFISSILSLPRFFELVSSRLFLLLRFCLFFFELSSSSCLSLLSSLLTLFKLVSFSSLLRARLFLVS